MPGPWFGAVGRGIEIRTGTSVEQADGVRLSDGEFVPTRSLIWCVGVRPDRMVARLGLPLQRGRLTVDEYLTVPGHPEIHACGDAAAVPDLTRPGSVTAMTAQHAQRQGNLAAENIAASRGLGSGTRRPYRHHDLGFVVDLGGVKAAADPLGVRLSGLPAKAVTGGYHLLAMSANRTRIATGWALDAVFPRQLVQLGLVRSGTVPLTAGTPNTRACPPRPHRGPELSDLGPAVAIRARTPPVRDAECDVRFSLRSVPSGDSSQARPA